MITKNQHLKVVREINTYCFENGHKIKNGRCVNCGKAMQSTPHYIEYWKTIKDQEVFK